MFASAVHEKDEVFDSRKSEKDILNEQQVRTLEDARVDHLDSLTGDQKKLTELKESLANNVLTFLWVWFSVVTLGFIFYFAHQVSLDKEIPKEVIISIFTCTAVIAGLVGYILKGLFGTKGI